MNNFIRGFANTTAVTTRANYEIDFISKYGNTTLDYNNLDQLGNIKPDNLFIIIFVMSVILCIMSFIFYSKTEDPARLTFLSSFLYYLGWFFVIVIVVMLGYGAFFYIFQYLPQYKDWYKRLPPGAKSELQMISALTNVVNSTSSHNNYNYNYKY
jgi:hypothetical protein